MEAAKHSNALAVRLLLRFGAQIEVADAAGRTSLMDASELSTKRLLLDSGADPDFGRLGGMTLMAFFATFRDRRMVELLRVYGADTGERIRKGPTVQEVLDDPEVVWNSLERPEARRKHAEFILEQSDGLRTSPERYVTTHRSILLWGLHLREYDDSRLKAWAMRVSELIGSPDLLAEAYQRCLDGDDLTDALKSLERPKRRAERERLRKARNDEFEEFYFKGEKR